MKRKVIKYIQSVSDKLTATRTISPSASKVVWLDEASEVCSLFRVQQEFIHSVMSLWFIAFDEVLEIRAHDDELLLHIKVFGAI